MRNAQNKSFFFSGYEIKNINSLISLFKSSIKYQTEFINELDQKLQNFISESQDDIDKFLSQTNNFMIVLPSIINQLGIPFAHNFLNTNFLNNLIDWIFDNEKLSNNIKEKIKNIFEAYMDVFRFIVSNDKLNNIRESLTDFTLIEKKDEINFKDAKEDEQIYENYYALLNGLKTLKEIGLDKEKIVELEKKYDKLKKDIRTFKYKNESKTQNGLEKNSYNNKAEIEFFERLIKDLDNYFIELNKSNVKISDNNNIIDINEKNEINFEKNEIQENLPPLHERTSLYVDEKLKERRNELIEFKSYSFPLTKEYMEDIRRQICGFLNSRGGRLYIGINGENKVKGVALNSKSRDNSRNSIVNLTHDFYPNCRLDKVTVDYIPVKDKKTNKFINRRYVVKIKILPGDPGLLYSMTTVGYNSTMRKNVQVYELNSTEIYKEIIDRDDKKLQNKDNINKEMYIKDPPPEININEDEDEDKDENGFPFFVGNKNKNFNQNNNNINNNNNNNNNKYKANPKPQGKKGKKNYMVKEGFISVKVTNIDQSLSKNDVNRFFNDCHRSSQNFFVGYGYLNFAHLNDANDCIARYNGKKLGNKNIKLSIVNNNK